MFPCDGIQIECYSDNTSTTMTECDMEHTIISTEFFVNNTQAKCYWVPVDFIVDISCDGDCVSSPTTNPTLLPTSAPSTPTEIPTNNPTIQPTTDPTNEPTFDPTIEPTNQPSWIQLLIQHQILL